VLPDASIRADSGTLGRNQSRCKEGMAYFLPSCREFVR